MEAKYYTPKISEFFMGFEFESLNTKGKLYYPDISEGVWVKNVIDYGVLSVLPKIGRLLADNQIRVRYLDEYDIVAEIWSKEGNCYKILGGDTDIFRMLVLADYWVSIHSVMLSKCVFHGRILNRSELHKVMEMVGIKK